jgi:hypothetical protein
MDTPTIRKRVKELGSGITLSNKSEDNSKEYLKNPYIMGTVAIFIILLLARPSFLYIEVNNERKFCMKKFFTYWVLFSFLSALAIYSYSYRPQ